MSITDWTIMDDEWLIRSARTWRNFAICEALFTLAFAIVAILTPSLLYELGFGALSLFFVFHFYGSLIRRRTMLDALTRRRNHRFINGGLRAD